MPKKQRSPVEKYHDRVAGLYDTIYDGNPYWETVFEITWRHMMKHIPRDQTIRCLDIGCGTGRWGLRLLKSGYRVDFLDISQKMIDQVGKKLDKREGSDDARLYCSGIDDLSMIESGTYGFLIGQGDPLCSAERPERAMKELTRILAPGGVMIQSVDNVYGGMRHFLKQGDIDGLEAFLKNGRTTWVTDDPAEQYPITAFTPETIRRMLAARGLELLSLIGKTTLPLRRFQDLLKNRESRARMIRLEEKLHAHEAMLGCAAHLEFAARKPTAP